MPETKSVSKLTKTANRDFKYDAEFDGHKLSDLSQEAHKVLSVASGWGYRPLVPGQFGYDNMIMSVGVAFTEAPNDAGEEDIAALVHEGWCRNYKYWRDEKPWLTKKG